MSKPCVKVVNTSNYPLPEYKTPGSAGMDLINVGNQVILEPGKRALFPTGLCIELPQGMEAQVRPRSGLALKQGITVNPSTEYPSISRCLSSHISELCSVIKICFFIF